jgi:hypothetical protein
MDKQTLSSENEAGLVSPREQRNGDQQNLSRNLHRRAGLFFDGPDKFQPVDPAGQALGFQFLDGGPWARRYWNGPATQATLLLKIRARKKDTSILAILVISCILYKKITPNKEITERPAAGPL